MPRLRLLLVDDQRMLAEATAVALTLRGGFRVLGRRATDDPRWPGAVASTQPDVVVLCSSCPSHEIGVLISQISASCPDTAVVVLTPTPDPAMAVATARAGAMAILGMDVALDRLVRVLEAVGNGHACYSDELLGAVLHGLRADAGRLRANDGQLSALSARECDVLRRMMAGKSSKEIARQMFISPNTVRSYSRSILTKLKVHSMLDAVAVARSAGWRCEPLPEPTPLLTFQAPHGDVRNVTRKTAARKGMLVLRWPEQHHRPPRPTENQ